MRILLVLPAGANVRVTPERPEVPKRAMLRFSVLSLTIVAPLTPRRLWRTTSRAAFRC